MKNEFTLAFNEVIEDKQLPKEVILKALESAMVSAYRKAVNASTAQHVEARIDPETGKVLIYAEKEVAESVQDSRTEVTLEEAKKVNPEAELGSMVIVETTPADFGRVAAQTARQVIQQRIRDAERQMQLAHFEKQLGEIISGTVQAINAQGLTLGLDMRAESIMARKDMIPGERFRIHDRVRALVAEVKDSNRGPQIVLSRTHRDFLRRLLENEVPEIYHGVVEIRSIAREPGERAKVAVSATQTGIDPVGACVGIRGVRIQAIVRELHDEKIDVIEWNTDPAIFISKAISPARVSGVYLNEKSSTGKTATVVVPEDQLSLAIGRDGQNARLAAKLTGWRIDIKSVSEAATEALYKLQQDPSLAALFQDGDQSTQVEALLAKRAENRALTPEEYDALARFVDRVERRSIARIKAEKETTLTAEMEALTQSIPTSMVGVNILDTSLPEHVAYILQEAGYATVGDLAMQMKSHPDDILRLQGIGPKAMSEINNLMEQLAAQKVAEEQAAQLLAAEAAAEQAVTVTPEPVGELAQQDQPGSEAAQPEAQVAEPVAEPALEGEPTEEETSFETIFTLRPDMVDTATTEEVEEEEEVTPTSGKTKKSKKKRKSVEVVYDPDRDVVVSKKKHKRGTAEWDWES